LSTAKDLGRQQMMAGLQGACALFRGFEAIRRIQQEAARHALERHEAVLDSLGDGEAEADPTTLQARLLAEDLQEAYAYWQQLFSVGWAIQRELLQECMGGAEAQSDDPNPLAQAMAPVFELYTNGTGTRRARAA
jgi:hypothetical protein